MKSMSFRTRLSLWTVLVLAVFLGGFGVAVWAAFQSHATQDIDRQLADNAHRFADGPGPPGQGGPDAQRPPQDGNGPPPANDPPPRDGAPRGWNAAAQRITDIRRPRFLDTDGTGQDPQRTGPWDAKAFHAALAGTDVFSDVVADGERVRVVSVARRRPEGIIGVVQLAHEMGEYDRLSKSQLGILAALFPAALVLAGFGSLFLADHALRPVRAVTRAAGEIGDQDLARRLPVQGDDELADLASTFNGMIARLESAFRARESAYAQLEAAYERQRRFTADASHELRTPLARIKLSTSEALSGDQTEEEYRAALGIADRAADALEKLIQQLLLLARSDAGQMPAAVGRVDLAQILRDARETVAPLSPAPILLELPDTRLEASGDASLLRRLFINLLENAARHTPAEGNIRITAKTGPRSTTVRVVDTGEGIPPEHLPHVTERFYRVDAARKGHGGVGLGLAICESIVQAHGGTLRIESQVGRGTAVTVELPFVQVL